jgi:hypothetical protein
VTAVVDVVVACGESDEGVRTERKAAIVPSLNALSQHEKGNVAVELLSEDVQIPIAKRPIGKFGVPVTFKRSSGNKGDLTLPQ